MEVVILTTDKYKEWDDFCLDSDGSWFFHTTNWLEYTLNYKPELKTQNLSFFVYEKGEIIGVVPLTLEVTKLNEQEIFEFSFGGGKIPAPALANDLPKRNRELLHKFIFTRIDHLASENKVKRSSFKQIPISPGFLTRLAPFNYLMKFGYIDISLNTQLIDLNRTEQELWDDLRRNHRRNIQKGRDIGFKIIIHTSKNINKDIFNDYKEMHHKAAGRQTRPDKTFELMYGWIKKDLGFLAFVELDGKKIGSEYYLVYKDVVHGASAANDSDYEHLPVRHFLEWEAILWMKNQGFSFCEIDVQQYGNSLSDFPDTKQLNISHFKKGFGGVTVPLFMGEKYYDKEYFLSVYQPRIKKYADYLDQNIQNKESDDN